MSVYDVAMDADAIVILTEWDIFSSIEWSRLSNQMRKPAWVFDTRRIADIEEMNSAGLNVWRIGDVIHSQLL